MLIKYTIEMQGDGWVTNSTAFW